MVSFRDFLTHSVQTCCPSLGVVSDFLRQGKKGTHQKKIFLPVNEILGTLHMSCFLLFAVLWLWATVTLFAWTTYCLVSSTYGSKHLIMDDVQ